MGLLGRYLLIGLPLCPSTGWPLKFILWGPFHEPPRPLEAVVICRSNPTFPLEVFPLSFAFANN